MNINVKSIETKNTDIADNSKEGVGTSSSIYSPVSSSTLFSSLLISDKLQLTIEKHLNTAGSACDDSKTQRHTCHNTTQHNTTQHCTTQHNTPQHNIT